MPIFEYRCPVCGYIFEKLVFGRSQEAPECPKCGAAKSEQQFSSFATAGAKPAAGCAPSGGA